jgi:acetyl esterase
MHEHMDPQLARVLAMMPVVDLSDIQAIRALNQDTRVPAAPTERAVETCEHAVLRRDGRSAIRVRLYRPEHSTRQALPAVLYCHPGLFFGSLEMDHERCVRFASDVPCIVVSVDYRLAPEYPFPAGLEDCYDSLVWIQANATELHIDTSRVGVAGCSSGATLAAGLSLMARDRAGPPLAFQLLVCPTLDDRLETVSMAQFANPGPMEAGRVGAAYMWRYYLGESDDAVSHYAAPARASDVSDLPPTYLVTAEYDCVRDEGLEYALRLIRAGVATELHHFSGCFHAFDLVARTAAVSQRAVGEQVAALRRALATPTTRTTRRPPGTGGLQGEDTSAEHSYLPRLSR